MGFMQSSNTRRIFSNVILKEPIENLDKSYQSLEELDHDHLNLYFQKGSEMKQALDKIIEMIAD